MERISGARVNITMDGKPLQWASLVDPFQDRPVPDENMDQALGRLHRQGLRLTVGPIVLYRPVKHITVRVHVGCKPTWRLTRKVVERMRKR